MRIFKLTFIIALVVSIFFIIGYFSNTEYRVLNLDTGKATAQHKVFGLTYRTYEDMHNPSKCPDWNNAINPLGDKTVSYSCYKYISTEGCIAELKAYQRAYESGCGL